MIANVIDSFTGSNEFLRNDYPATIVVDGLLFPTVEHAFQAAKTTDLAEKEAIRMAPTANEAKKLGRHVQLVADWDTQRIDIMTSLVLRKFVEHIDLKIKLLMTGNQELIQGGTKKGDFWGENQGKILMQVRDKIRALEGSPQKVFETFLQEKNLGFLVGDFNKVFQYGKDTFQDDTEALQFLKDFTV
jgi:ribA/ribD-fused uncharacterized protein